MDGIMLSDTYELFLDGVKASSGDYHLKEVTGNYVLFVLKGYSENLWINRAFDNNGNLIATIMAKTATPGVAIVFQNTFLSLRQPLEERKLILRLTSCRI